MSLIGFPTSRVSIRASSSAWASIRSAKRIRTFFRSAGAVAAQPRGGAAGRLDRPIDVLGAALRDLGDRPPGRRVLDLVGPAADGVDERTANEGLGAEARRRLAVDRVGHGV